MGEPVQGAFKGIGFRFGCQFQASPVFPYKPRPFLTDTPVRTGLRIVPVHEPDIAVDDLKGCPFFTSAYAMGISCFLYCS